MAPANADLALGEQIWRGGIAAKGLPACAACHGPAGAGNGPAGFPSLAGRRTPATLRCNCVTIVKARAIPTRSTAR